MREIRTGITDTANPWRQVFEPNRRSMRTDGGVRPVPASCGHLPRTHDASRGHAHF
jgi:hypothetical protein